MKKIYLFLFIFSACNYNVFAQTDSIISRLIFIGDAGEVNKPQQKLIEDAQSKILENKTKVVFLGDNIYPSGMPISTDNDSTQIKILQSQYQPFRKNNTPVIFIPGNHDWDKSGPEGLEKVQAQSTYIDSLNDSLVQFLPKNGCADPVEVSISDSLTMIVMDSEWWLFPYDKSDAGADCNCNDKRAVINALGEIMYRNRYKTILLATHHPFQSYGTHGGYFTWKDHIFPLTAINRNLYLPLPVVGSLYPLMRKTLNNPEDLRHPVYQDMIKSIDGVFKSFPNLIHVSGHEHGLQYIENEKTGETQIVSGGGSKENYTFQGKNSLFGVEDQGYVVLDEMPNHQLKFTFYTLKNDSIQPTFTHVWSNYKPVKAIEDAQYQSITTDSLTATVHPAYGRTSWLKNALFGTNYRKEWSTPALLPVIRISDIEGGLTPEKLGGGFQSTSLRLQNKDGKEYALRLVEKSPDLIVPDAFKGTFVKNLLDDATSAQHPYSALVVGPVADAVGVPHSHPEIGVVAPDKNLGMYERLFANKVALLEEREPLGKSDNFIKFLKNLQKDNDNSFDGKNYLKARMVDLLFADWDRHGDQWRFYNENPKGEDKYYIAIPRDRDMVFYKTEGFLPFVAKHYFVMPHVWGFRKNLLPGSNYYFFKSAFLNPYPASQIDYATWMSLANEFKNKVTDSVLDASLKQMPTTIYNERYNELYTYLKARRDKIPEALDKYYKFSNEIVDIRLSDKNEFVSITNTPDSDAVHINVLKINKHGSLKDTLINKTYPRSITKEIRLYTGEGDDSILVDNQSNVRIKLIGDKGDKSFNILHSKHNIPLYDYQPRTYSGMDADALKPHISKDTNNTHFVATNLYNTYLPLATAGYNIDDGIALGIGARLTFQKGFRKAPYTSMHQFMFSHYFGSQAFAIKYNGEWIHLLGNADLLLDVNIKAPDNTQNFFGRGNETDFDKRENYSRYYRIRYDVINFSPSLRWRFTPKSTLVLGPSLEFYHANAHENEGRFINNTSLINSYDSTSIYQNKLHLGVNASYTYDNRNNAILPTYGCYFNINALGYIGANKYSKSYMQFMPEFAVYKSLNTRQTIVVADRIGGGVTIGKSAFYQSLFLGSQGNLTGFRKFRFAGQHTFYNNLEMRIALLDFGNYVVKGQLGIIGLYDVGRVWVSDEHSDKWHNGYGGGVYFAPANMVVFKFLVGKSDEGWYPTFAMGMRF